MASRHLAKGMLGQELAADFRVLGIPRHSLLGHGPDPRPRLGLHLPCEDSLAVGSFAGWLLLGVHGWLGEARLGSVQTRWLGT